VRSVFSAHEKDRWDDTQAPLATALVTPAKQTTAHTRGSR